MTPLPPPIRAMVEATNRGGSEAFLDTFTDDAVLDDWGRTFTGRAEIAVGTSENVGVKSHVEATSVERDGDAIRFGVAVSGERYNGGGPPVCRS